MGFALSKKIGARPRLKESVRGILSTYTQKVAKIQSFYVH
jgi:hypothetical protein